MQSFCYPPQVLWLNQFWMSLLDILSFGFVQIELVKKQSITGNIIFQFLSPQMHLTNNSYEKFNSLCSLNLNPLFLSVYIKNRLSLKHGTVSNDPCLLSVPPAAPPCGVSRAVHPASPDPVPPLWSDAGAAAPSHALQTLLCTQPALQTALRACLHPAWGESHHSMWVWIHFVWIKGN